MEDLSTTAKLVITGIFIFCGLWLLAFTSVRKAKMEKNIRLAYTVLALVMIALPLILVIGV